MRIKAIKQVDNYHFQIVWQDGKEQLVRLSSLQELCPCAKCFDEQTGKRRSTAQTVSSFVRASVVKNVGRYGIRVEFTEGCSTGIYSYKLIREMGEMSSEIY